MNNKEFRYFDQLSKKDQDSILDKLELEREVQ